MDKTHCDAFNANWSDAIQESISYVSIQSRIVLDWLQMSSVNNMASITIL